MHMRTLVLLLETILTNGYHGEIISYILWSLSRFVHAIIRKMVSNIIMKHVSVNREEEEVIGLYNWLSCTLAVVKSAAKGITIIGPVLDIKWSL